MTTRLPGPLPCAYCDALVASADPDEQDPMTTLRWFLDDREAAAGRPHRHVSTATPEDHAACSAALWQEVADEDEEYRVLDQLAELELAVVLADDQETVGEGLARLEASGSTTTTHMVNALTERALAIEDRRTHYLGGKRVIGRDEHGEVWFLTGPRPDGDEG